MNRRQLLRTAGAAALTTAMSGPLGRALAQTTCTVVPAPSLTEGPYFVDEILHRSDIRMDPTNGAVSTGFPLHLDLNLSRVDDCAISPLAGAFVDIWQCDAQGVYSDVTGAVGRKFLRGYQITDRGGKVNFTTIFPGWYQGRAVHIHFKVRYFSRNEETYEFTSQFFFEDAMIDEMYRLEPYAAKGAPDTRNVNDGIYSGASTLGPIASGSGSHLLLKPTREDAALRASFDLVLNVAAGSTPDAAPGGPGGPGGPGPGGPPPARP